MSHRKHAFTPKLRVSLLTLLSCLLLVTGSLPVFSQTIISEFMADNETVLADQDGDFEDWIEIFHPGPSSLDLGGYYLTDDANELAKWRLPSETLSPGGYLVVFASGKDRSAVGSELHTNFKIDADGEYLALVDPDGVTVVSEFGPAFPEQYPDVSYGFQTVGVNDTLRAGQPGFLISHTPGTANTVIPGPHPLYCDDSLARIDITASQAVWDGLQAGSPTASEGAVTLRFRQGDIDVTVANVGIRARGNTSLTGYPRSFRISFDTFVPGSDLFGLEKLNLNSERNDPSTARSKLCLDLHAAAGLPAEYANHVALVVHGPDNHRTGPDGVFFDAVLNNTQPVDDVFVKQRFKNTRGNLYKSVWPGDLEYHGSGGGSYVGRYELKYQGSTDGSFDDLAHFIDILHNTPDADFPAAIRDCFEVDDYLKQLALDVLTSNWDGHWGNWNNFYLYRNPGNGKWNYIAFDLDNTFSIEWIEQGAWAARDMYSWGARSSALAERLLAVDEFRHRYTHYMNQFVQTFYQNSVLDPVVHRTRLLQTAALPFGGLGISNCKFSDRLRYEGDWPNWSYSEYYDSFDTAQSAVPNFYGITEFITVRRANTLSQLNLVNIGPILSDLEVAPSLPGTNEPMVVSIRAKDDVSISSVDLYTSFAGSPYTGIPMLDDGDGADARAGDGVYTATLPAVGVAGTLAYYVRAEDSQGKALFEPWGGLTNAATLPVASPYLNLALTEFNYHPHEPEGTEPGVSSDGEDYEFIELCNLGASPLDLEGVEFIAGISYRFPSESLAPGERVVIVSDTAAFTARYGPGLRVSGEYNGQLSNGGEPLHLVDPGGATIRDFSYQDVSPWPTRADGHGSTLELLDPEGEYGDPANWRASLDYGGSPGAAETLLPRGVVINEVLSHTDPPLVDLIELHNPTEGAIQIGGWYLSDSEDLYRKYPIPPGTVLPAGGYITFDETNHFNTSMQSNITDFALDAARGDHLWLLEADADADLRLFVDHVDFEAAANGEAFGRWPNGTGDLYPMIRRTFGGSNAGPRVGPVVISELMYQPASGDPTLEFVEVCNGGGMTEALGGWSITGDVDFTFPSNTFLPPGEVVAVLSFDPDAPGNSATLDGFRSHYGIGANEILMGPYLGSLDDIHDIVRLRRPDSPPAEDPTFTPMLLEDEVGYYATLPWPPEAAGGGPSLMRTGPGAWGNDPQSWRVNPTVGSTPGRSPTHDGDGDGIPDVHEIERYGGTNVVGNPTGADTDGDGTSDQEEYIAGTSATDAGSRLKARISLLPGKEIRVEFETLAIAGPGYFGRDRCYTLEEAGQIGFPGSWAAVPSHSSLPATGATLTYTNPASAGAWWARVRVSLEY